jgi:hypothetical protein
MSTNQNLCLATVSGTLGKFKFDVITGMVVGRFYPVDDPPEKIDVDEYAQSYPNTPIQGGQTYDVLDLGYTTVSGSYETPTCYWRAERDYMVMHGELPY